MPFHALGEPQSDTADTPATAVLRQAPVPMAIVDGPDWRFAFANDACLALTGQRDLRGRTIAESLPEPVARHLVPLLERTRSSGLPCVVDEFGVLFGDDEQRERFCRLMLHPLAEPEQAATILIVGVDVTAYVRARQAAVVASPGVATRSQAEDRHIAMKAELVHRAQDLQRANQQLRLNEERLQAEIGERTRAEDAREQLLHRLVDAQEQERRRIARELHDTLGQHLTALDVGLKTLGDLKGCPASVTGSLNRLRGLAARIGDEVDRLAYELRPQVLDDLGLASAICHYVDEWSRDTGIATDVHLHGLEDRRLSEALETTVFRVVQEALTNVRRHAAASSANVVVECRGGELLAIVEDRGCGFSPEQPASDGRRGLGLLGMRERATLVGGIFDIETRPGHGTTIYLRVPLS